MDQMLPRPATPGEALLMRHNNIQCQENHVRSQNEQALYAAWKIGVEGNKTLNSLIAALNDQMQGMSCEIENLKTKIFRREN